jgi:hypothetical protein
LFLDYIINATVGRISGFSLGEGDNRTIGAIAATLKAGSFSELTEKEGNVQILVIQRISNGVMESDAHG